jgi:hypothetical protein
LHDSQNPTYVGRLLRGIIKAAIYEQAAAGQKRAIEMYERAAEMHDGQIADWKRLYDQAHEALQAARSHIIEIAAE